MLSFFSSLRQQHRNTDGVHDPPLVADQIAHVDEIVRSVGPTSVDGLAVFTSLEASNALLLTMEAYVDDDGAGRRPLLGTSAPHDLQPLCHDAGTGEKEGRIRGGGGVVVVFRRRRLGCSTRPGATATPGRPARARILI